jgi:hypothetical protein
LWPRDVARGQTALVSSNERWNVYAYLQRKRWNVGSTDQRSNERWKFRDNFQRSASNVGPQLRAQTRCVLLYVALVDPKNFTSRVNGQVRVAVGGQVKVSIPWLVFSWWCGVLLSGSGLGASGTTPLR